MKKIKETQGSGFYIFESRASANSNYIESIVESKRLLTYLNYYLNNYLSIHEYVISRHGFQIAVKLKSATVILKNYSFSGKKINRLNEDDVWRIVSEKIRLAISTYVRFANRNRERKGTLVEEKYSRYYFESLEEAKTFLNRMRNQNMKSFQRKKYRGIKSHYKILSRIAKGSIFLSSLELKIQRKRLYKELNTTVYTSLNELVVPNLLKRTKYLHNHLNTNNIHPPPIKQ